MPTKSSRAIAAQLEAAAQTCSQHGTQLTALRRTVLAIILEAKGPLTAYQLLDQLKKTRTGAAPPTIYRALKFLLDNKLIHRIEMLNAFVPCVEAGCHAHSAQFLICRRCGTVAEVDDHAISKAVNHAARGQGFQAENTVVEIEGACASCATSAS